MEAYTYQELRKLATEKKIRGRSKLRTKADLWEALNSLIDDFGKLDIKRKTSTIEDYLVSEMEEMNIEDKDEDEDKDDQSLNSETDPIKTTELVNPSSGERYSFVVVECPYVEDAFPVLVHEDPSDETSPIEWNDFMYHFFSYKNKYDGVWVSTKSKPGQVGEEGGPIGFKSDINVPMDVRFETYTDGSVIEKDDDVKCMTIYPCEKYDPREIGYNDLLEKYGKFDPANNSYYVDDAIEFCKELIERSETWNYSPDFIEDLRAIFKENGFDFDNKIVFVDVEKDDIEDFQRTVLKYPAYENCHFTLFQEFLNSDDNLCAFLIMKER